MQDSQLLQKMTTCYPAYRGKILWLSEHLITTIHEALYRSKAFTVVIISSCGTSVLTLSHQHVAASEPRVDVQVARPEDITWLGTYANYCRRSQSFSVLVNIRREEIILEVQKLVDPMQKSSDSSSL